MDWLKTFERRPHSLIIRRKQIERENQPKKGCVQFPNAYTYNVYLCNKSEVYVVVGDGGGGISQFRRL